MKRIILLIVLTIFTGSVTAATFSMQGVLRDPLGKTVADGAYQLTFRIYEQETGGSAIWSETQADVQVGHGVFGAELGIIASLDAVPFDAAYWVGVSIEDGIEIEPRFKMNRVPATMSLCGSDKIIPAVGNMGIGTQAPGAALHIKIADAAADQLLIEGADGSAYLKVAGDGKMGINLENPEQTLDIDGYLKMRSGGIMFADGSTLSSAAMGGSADSVSNPDTVLITADSDGNGSGTIDLIIGSATKMQVGNDGNTTFSGDITASKLIDGNDETYYVDPDNQSKLARLGLNGAVPSDTYPLSVNGNIMANAFYDNEDLTYRLNLTDNKNKFSTLALGGMDPDPAYPLKVDGHINFTGSLLKNGQIWAPVYWTEIYMGARTSSHVGIYTAPRSDYWLSVGRSMRVADGNIYFRRNHSDTEGDPGFISIIISQNYNSKMTIHSDDSGEIQFKTGATSNYLTMTSAGFSPSTAGFGRLGKAGNYWEYICVEDLYRTNEYSLSDRRVKRNIKDLDSSLDKLMALRGVKYEINTDTHPFYKDRELEKGEELPVNLGFIAQELQEVIPEMVAPGDKDKFYTIRNYEQMLPVIVAAVQELNAEKDAEIIELEEIADRIKEKNRQLQQRIDNLAKN